MLLFIWMALCFVFLMISEWLLITLLMLEIMTFIILTFMSLTLSSIMVSDMLILCFFSVFVMEGVIALAGLISLVSFTGSDYMSSSSIIKC